jgi:NurA-like 5'-3' nuclease
VPDGYVTYLLEVRENAEITAKNKEIIINALRKRVSSL